MARARPEARHGMMGMAGACLIMGMTDVAIAISFGFLGFFRSNEIFGLLARQVSVVGDRIVVSLEETKASARKKAYEVVTVRSELVARMLNRVLQDCAPGQRIVGRTPYQLRRILRELIAIFGLGDFNFQYSTRSRVYWCPNP